LTLVGEAFTPAGPVDTYSLFSGRADKLQDVLGAVAQRGQHVALYGERGVGKTSLANIIPEVYELVRPGQLLSGKVNANTDGGFATLWKNIYRELGISELPPDPGPEDVRYTLAQSGQTTLIVIDELDRMDDDEALSLLADTVKSMSDHSVPATLVLVGVADSVGELIGEHASIVRNLVQIEMPRMAVDELREIIDKGCEHAKLTASPDAVAEITGLSEGLPHYTHLLSLNAAQRVVMDDRSEITRGDVNAAVPSAVDKHTLQSDYLKAVRSPRPVHLFKEVLLACAFAQKNQLGYFTPGAVRDPLEIIVGRRLEIPAFSRHLKEFLGPAHANVLEREGLPRKYFYRFSDPIMQPYVILNGISEGLISEEQLQALRTLETRSEGSPGDGIPPTESQRLF
jgi:energy-coupling factor transporter ATP-binding protein EcfA2